MLHCASLDIIEFKGFESETIDFASITILVGGNNAGKSSVLQALHFGVSVFQTIKEMGALNFVAPQLRYCPTEDFLDLKTNGRLTEGSGLTLVYKRISDDGEEDTCKLDVKRGRNGAVSTTIKPARGPFFEDLSNVEKPFTIYVPGLSGVPLNEEYRSDRVVEAGIARGDANLYLRNVLYRILTDDDDRQEFERLLAGVFPDLSVSESFDIRNDHHIRIYSRMNDVEKPIDMLGTGALQAVQLVAYVTKYKPSMLLLDEPDAHLHPNNQRILCSVLRTIAAETGTQIVVATHSRHFIDEFLGDPMGSVIWLQNKKVAQSDHRPYIGILADLGALDEGEKFLHPDCSVLVWTEDDINERKNRIYIETLLAANGFNINEVQLFSYNSSSKLESALMLCRFVHQIRDDVHVIIHRDRDFMTDEEVQALVELYKAKGVLNENVHLFVTQGCDIESYFVRPGHLCEICGLDNERVDKAIDAIIDEHKVEIVLSFKNKRDNVKFSPIYDGRRDDCPSAQKLLGRRPGPQHCLGKFLAGQLRQELKIKNLVKVTDHLGDDLLTGISRMVWPRRRR